MSFRHSLEEFRVLHARARGGELGPDERVRYRVARGELNELLLTAQHLALQPGHAPRSSVRVARLVQAEVVGAEGPLYALTVQLSRGGFGALLSRAPRDGERVQVKFRFRGGAPLNAAARAVSIRQQEDRAYVSFQFVDLDLDTMERLEVMVFDAVLDQLASA